MSADLFTNANEALQRLESVLEAKMTKYCLMCSKDKVGKTGETVIYAVSISGTTRTGKHVIHTINGVGFPDLFAKISDYIVTLP